MFNFINGQIAGLEQDAFQGNIIDIKTQNISSQLTYLRKDGYKIGTNSNGEKFLENYDYSITDKELDDVLNKFNITTESDSNESDSLESDSLDEPEITDELNFDK